MVVLAASICTRGGKPIISRQFRDMSRSRVEVLLSSFPKLISSNSQHTSIETDSVRYVYQPLEDLYMILITNKNSNILQDIDTLHLFSRLVTDMCGSATSMTASGALGGAGMYGKIGSGRVDERQVLRLSFELLGAFDEVIAMGYRENVSLMQIKNTLEMESHEEKIQEIIERNKEQEAKEELKRRAKQLEMQRREATRRGVPASNFGAQMAAGGPGGFASVQQQAPATVHRENLGADRSGTGSTGALLAKPFKGKGMQLGKKAKTTSILGDAGAAAAAAAAASEAANEAASASAPAPVGSQSAATIASTRTPSASAAASDPSSLLPPISREAVHILVRERISLQADRDGSVTSMELKGDLEVRISDPALAKVRLSLADTAALSGGDAAMNWKTHPHVDKAQWSAGKVIALKDANKSFPVNQTLGVLRWRNTALGKDESNVPISITCWPSPNTEGGAEVTIEFNTDALETSAPDAVLRGVSLIIPLPATLADPALDVAIGEVAVGEAHVAEEGDALIWLLGDELRAGESGSLEFTVSNGVEGEDVSSFFPVQVDFWGESTIGKVQVASIVSTANDSNVSFSQQSILSPESYHVG
ncbi:hypothetical protein K437DRAFT_237880 [Tilletiaria anomala UBC 951]|uniref:Coatomer subunit delta n=1 Tax=Tilletiaria anomala (strain ATCC 24038 / CBS 436.72 / UBC 951) TaxID=1037660 RepID=A0A066VTP4_TILAU|nr:uncharacterized protein K437DRAFT_237880 [Tilletiaria anomala UBC 951]KDN42184.1 hypothetical protein K437DRAFT_237880 [Tilletiaria anomala UBC 951]